MSRHSACARASTALSCAARLTLTHFTELVSARPPRPREAEQLQIPAAYPVIEVTRVAYAGDRVIEANRMIMSAERYQLVYQIAAD